MIPRTRRARVAGIYHLGLYEFDSSYGFVSIPFGERLTGMSMIELIQLRVTDIYDAPRIADDIPKRLGTAYVAQDWADLNQSLFSALGIEKMAISITIGLIVIVAALNIVASLILLVMEKSRDIAILKTMGTAPRRIMTIFMLQGLIIGVTGTLVGGLGGLALCRVLDKYRLIKIPADVYQVAYVPFVVLPRDFTIVIISAVVSASSRRSIRRARHRGWTRCRLCGLSRLMAHGSRLRAAALLCALFTIVIGAAGIVSPGTLTTIRRLYFATPASLYVAAGIRLAMGLVLILSAPASRAPAALRALGAVVCMQGLAAALLGPERARAVLEWEAAQTALLRAGAVVALAAGAFIAFAVTTARPKTV